MTNRMQSAIYVNGNKIEMDYPQFNGGERNIKLPDEIINTGFLSDPSKYCFTIYALLFDSKSIMDMLLVSDALDSLFIESPFYRKKLFIPYLPYARQDRLMVKGEALGVRTMANLINSINAESVTIFDCHSDVGPALINNCINVSQEELVSNCLNFNTDLEPVPSDRCPKEFIKYCKDVVVIAPDGGAIKKAFKIARSCVNARFETAGKTRDVTNGNIVDVSFKPNKSVDDKTCLIPDDIADNGMSFRYLGMKILNEHKPNKLGLLVTHGIFASGTNKLYEIFDDIFTIDYINPEQYKIIRL